VGKVLPGTVCPVVRAGREDRMSVADRLDEIRADAWLLARRTRRLGRGWQSQLERLADRIPKRAAKASRRLSRRARAISRQVDQLVPAAAGSVVAGLIEPAEASIEQAGRGLNRLSRRITRGLGMVEGRAERLTDRLTESVAGVLEAVADRSEQATDRLTNLIRSGRLRRQTRRDRAKAWLEDMSARIRTPVGHLGERLEGRGEAAQEAMRRWWQQREELVPEDGGSMLRRAAKGALGLATIRRLAEEGEEVGHEAGTAIRKMAKGTAGMAMVRRLTGRGERARIHPVAWWLGFGVALAGVVLWMNDRRITTSLRHLTPAPGETVHRYPTAFGEMAYRVVGDGPPLLLIHGLGPGASHHLFDRNIDALARHFKVYAIDLLGFGLSDKPHITYTGDRMAQTITDFLRDVVGGKATVVASGLAGAFAARALAQHPELAEHLVLVNPIGQSLRTLGRGLATALGSVPILGRNLYYGMTGKSRMADRLKSRYFQDPSLVSDKLVEQFVANARQPGADRAIRDLIAGRLDLDLACELSDLQVPLSIIWGRHAMQPTLERTRNLVEAKPGAHLCVFENSGMFPQTDETDSFNQFLVDRFAEQKTSPGGRSSSR
jgi:pimeloyl-ACP methyl ester carboxylesterase